MPPMELGGNAGGQYLIEAGNRCCGQRKYSVELRVILSMLVWSSSITVEC